MLALAFGVVLCAPLQDAQDLLDSGNRKLAQGDFQGAREDYSKAINLKPDFADAYLRRGGVLADLKEYAAAVRDLTRAIELTPKSGFAYFFRAAARAELDDLAGAGADASKAIEFGVKLPRAYEIRALDRARRDHLGALADYDEALRLDPSSKTAYWNRGVSRFYVGDVRGTIVDLSETIGTSPTELAYFIRGWCYGMLGSWRNALRDFRRPRDLRLGLDLVLCLSTWIARVQLGERKAADDDLTLILNEAPLTARVGPVGQLARYLLGYLSEKDLLEKLPGAKDQRIASFWIAMKRTAEGDAAGATPFLDKAVSDEHNEGILARLARAAGQTAVRKKAVELLLEKARTLRSFHAEFEIVGPGRQEDDKDEEFDPTGFVVDGDLDARRFLARLNAAKGAEVKTAYFLLEGDTMTAWGFEPQAYRMPLGSFFKQIDGLYDVLFQDLDRLVPPEKKADEPEPPREFSLLLDLEPKSSKEERASVRAAVKWTARSFSWLDAASGEGPEPTREGPFITFDLPRQKKKISMDEATGFLAGLEVTDYDGKIRRLARRRFAAKAEFPDLVVPAKPVTVPVPFDQLQRYVQECHKTFGGRLAAVFDRWDRIVQEGKEEAAKKLATLWAARSLDLWHAHVVRDAARRYLKWKLDNGATLEDLFKAPDEETASFNQQVRTNRETLRKHLEAALSTLRIQARSDLIGLPIDSRQHELLKEFLKEALDFERVEAERSKGDGEQIDKIFREELEAQKRL